MVARNAQGVVVARTKVAAALALGIAAMIPAGYAHARDMTGKAGFGAMATVSGMPLAAVRYWRTNLAFEFLFGWTAFDRSLPTVQVGEGATPDSALGQGATPERITTCSTQLAALPAASQSEATLTCDWRQELSVRRFALGALLRIADAPRASLAVGVRPWLQLSNRVETPTYVATKAGVKTTVPTAATPDSLAARWGVEIPVVAEFFLNDHISISGQLGLGFGWGATPELSTQAITQTMGDDDVWLALQGNWSGGVGLLFYF